ncbi:MAG: DUF2490 domain-containing protein [Bacteroidota bacterium]
MMTIKRERNIYYLFFVLTFLITGELCAQQKDFATWWEISMDGRLNSGINLSGELEQRMEGNGLRFDRTLMTVSGDYNLTDYLNVAGGFRTLFLTDRESRPGTRYRLHTDAKGHHSFSRTDLSLRVRLQYGFEDIIYMGYISQNKFISRQRLKLSHAFFGTRLEAFASLENWIRFNDKYGRPFYKIRATAGAEYKLTMHSGLSIRYILEQEFNSVDPLQFHILALGYSYTF